MKPLILLLSIISLTLSSVFAQTFGGGFLGGLSASQLDGDNWGGYHKIGLTAGAYTFTQLNKYVKAQLELRYTEKGSKSNSKDPSVFYQARLNYIEAPIMLKYTFLQKLNADIGLTAGYLVKGTEDDGYGELEADPPFKPYELSFLIGVQYQILEKLHFNIRFNYSILPVGDHPGSQTWLFNRGQYNNVLTFAVYYQLANFGKK
ncbi:MAG: outer membrane beta-barrel protein [Bacteroidales bacterium]